MKVKYLATLSCLLTGSIAQAIEIMPINTGAGVQTMPAMPVAAPPVSNEPAPAGYPIPDQNMVYTPPIQAQPQVPSQLQPSTQIPAYLKANPKIQKSPINLLSKNKARMHKPDTKPLQMANKWLQKPASPASGREGSIMYVFGASLPSLVCAPLRVCAIRLQAGEVVNQIDIGDAERWRITPSVSGNGATATTSLVVKPIDSGLKTNMLVSTNYRQYKVELISTENEWMPEIAFTYAEEPLTAWSNYTSVYNDRDKVVPAAPSEPTPHAPMLPKIHFNYKISGDEPSWRPTRVYSDGIKTYIEFSDAICADEAPALIAIDDAGREQLVNYRMIDKHRYMIDKVIQEAILVTGVDDDQTRVQIDREE